MASRPWAMSVATVASAVVIEAGPAEPAGPATAGSAMAVGGPDVVALVICPGFRGGRGEGRATECADRRQPVETPFAAMLGGVSVSFWVVGSSFWPALTSGPLHVPFRATLRAPITTMHRYRSHTCGELRAADIGREARLSGWCHRIRDHGGLLFIDLRDHYGITQCVADPDSPVFRDIEKLRSEWVVRLDGKIRNRPAGTVNPDLPTGEVELFIHALEALGPAAELPMPVFGDQEYPEDIRLEYRFLDLRRERLHQNIMRRGAIIDSLRRRMKEQGFFEFQTPILIASSPEGARDYLVPSRLHPGKFYALPQAPQQFKQLTMIAGFDRYFQIAPCFRDEAARADRSPGEFYQLDFEMSFVTQEDVFNAVEPVIHGVFDEFKSTRTAHREF